MNEQILSTKIFWALIVGHVRMWHFCERYKIHSLFIHRSAIFDCEKAKILMSSSRVLRTISCNNNNKTGRIIYVCKIIIMLN